MSRYIDADAILEKVQFRVRINDDTDKTVKRCVEITRNLIENAPTADVAPVVHGRWLTWEEKFPGKMTKKKSRLGVFCSACQNYADNMSDYCPNCGCRMDEEEGESDGTKS